MTHAICWRATFAAASLAMLASASAALGASKTSVSYLPIDTSLSVAYIVNWNAKSHRVHVVETMVNGDGSYADDGTQRLVTFDGAGLPPYLIDTVDCNDQPMHQSVEITQMVFRPVSGTLHKGTARVVEIGYMTDIGGCTPGQQTPFGSTADPGTFTNNLDMADRASIADLVPGARLAGPSEDPSQPGRNYFLQAQVTTFDIGTLTFQTSGRTWPYTVSDGWIVLDFGTFQRGYTRVTRNANTGVETWIIADWQAGTPLNAEPTPMVEPNAAAGFGSKSSTAHVWNEGLFAESSFPYQYHLYKDHTGLRVFNGDIENWQPVTWSSMGAGDAAPLNIRRDVQDSYFSRNWVPLANYGRNHFVMESEDIYDLQGNFLQHYFGPRINWYVDEGKAVEGMN